MGEVAASDKNDEAKASDTDALGEASDTDARGQEADGREAKGGLDTAKQLP